MYKINNTHYNDMRIIIIVVMCFSLISCNLLKNTNKESVTNKSKIDIKEQRKNVIDYQQQTRNVNVNTSIQEEINFNGYTVQANQIKINNDGLSALGDAKISVYNKNINKLKDSTNTINNNNIKTNINETTNNSLKEKNYNKEVKKEYKVSDKVFLFTTVVFVIALLLYYNKKNK